MIQRTVWARILIIVIMIVGATGLNVTPAGAVDLPEDEVYVSPTPDDANSGRAVVCGLTYDQVTSIERKMAGRGSEIIVTPGDHGDYCIIVFDMTAADIEFLKKLMRELREALGGNSYACADIAVASETVLYVGVNGSPVLSCHVKARFEHRLLNRSPK